MNDRSSLPFGWQTAAFVFAACLAIYSVPFLLDPLLSTHEAVHCQNVNEMLADHDWIVPHYGGRPWLERPPLPHWMTASVVAVFDAYDQAWAYRLASMLAGAGIATLVAWMASLWFGRNMGVLSAMMLATTREFHHYALAPECDIFLCLVITAAIACFVRAEFGSADGPKRLRFFGTRPWPVLAMFVLLGLTNMAKGLYFGMTMASIPIAAFVLSNRSWTSLRRYFWFWGMAAFAACAMAWPLAAWYRYPDITELWSSDYMGRLSGNYMTEPVWYYFVQEPWAIFPWTLMATIGLVAAFPKAWNDPRSPERFLYGWAVGTLLVLTIPKGKHHHYLLHSTAAWAVLSALGARATWDWLRARSYQRIVALGQWRTAVTMLAVVVVGFWSAAVVSRVYMDNYRSDREFITAVERTVAPTAPLLVLGDYHVLDAAWILFYLPDRAKFLHNPTFLHDESIPGTEAYIVAHAAREREISEFGKVEQVAQSAKTRAGRTGPECWTLYRLTYDENIWRGPATVRFSPLQGTGRAEGPFLQPPQVAAEESTETSSALR